VKKERLWEGERGCKREGGGLTTSPLAQEGCSCNMQREPVLHFSGKKVLASQKKGDEGKRGNSVFSVQAATGGV